MSKLAAYLLALALFAVAGVVTAYGALSLFLVLTKLIGAFT